jgi:phosphoribosylamine--glycine ligase
LKALNERGITYKGVVCSNLMLTDKGPYVLEFNARFGDPEAEIILPLMETDFVDVIEAIINNRLSDINIRWSSQVAISIAIAAKGYPEDTITGDLITGLDDQVEQTITFHAGTALQNDEVITAGGRVLIITALGPTLADARDKAYQRIAQIRFDGLQYRRDIGWKSLNTQIS